MACNGLERAWRVGVVSYLNAKPLVRGLEANSRAALTYAVPSRLPALLDDGEVDAALVPVVDLAGEHRAWRIVSDACIACDGESLTVRVFSRVPLESIRKLHVDGDSHTSVVLARVIWREMYGCQLEVVPFLGNCAGEACEAVLLIGDKVVHNALSDYPIETDLGSSWKVLTSLPFVFAVWAAPENVAVESLAARLSNARDAGVASAGEIALKFGPAMGWPALLAERYLTAILHYTLGPRQRLGLAKFFELARKHGIVPSTRELVFV